MTLLVYFLGLVHLINCTLITTESNDTKLSIFTANFLKQNCNKCSTILVIHAEDDPNVDYFLKLQEMMCGIYTIKLDNFTGGVESTPEIYKQDTTIIFLNGMDLENVLFGIEIEYYWNIRGKFLVISPNEEDVEKNFQSFWERQAPRVIQIYWGSEGPKIYAQDPFFDQFKWDVTDVGDLGKIFDYKIRNMNGHPIKLYNLDVVFKDRFNRVTRNGKEMWVGMDGKFFGAVSEWLNASIILHPITEDFPADIVNSADHNVPIGDFVKVLADIYDFDAMANAGRTYMDNTLDHVFLYDRNDMFIVVPRGQLIPRYLYIFLIVPLDVWSCILFSLVAVTLVMIVFRKWDRKAIDLVQEIINNYRLLLNESIPDRTQNNQERFLTLIWIFHSLIVATLFQSMLTTTLVVPKYYSDINTLEDLYKTDLKIYVPHFSLLHLSRGLSEENKQFLKHLVEIPHDVTVYGEDVDWIEKYRQNNSAIIVSTEQVYYLKSKSKNSLRRNFHVMSESIMPNVQAYNIRNEKLFYEEFLLGMGLIRQAGLYHHWRTNNYDINEINITIKNHNHEQGDKGLTIEHLQVAFMFLLLGGGVGFTVFLLEFAFNKIFIVL